MRLPFLTPVLLASLLAAGAGAQPRPAAPGAADGAVYIRADRRYLPSRNGQWQLKPNDILAATGGVAPITAAERKQIGDTLDALRDIQRATTFGAPLTGVNMVEVRVVEYPSPYLLPAGVAATKQPLLFSAVNYPHAYIEERVGGTWQVVTGETEAMEYQFNELPGSLQGQDEWIAEEPSADGAPRRYYLRPRVTGTFAGQPVYEDGTLVFTRRGREPWQPATYGAILRALLKGAEGRLREMDTAWREVRESDPSRSGATPPKSEEWYWSVENEVRDLRAMVAAKTPQQLAGPVCRRVREPEQVMALQVPGELLPDSPGPACREVVSDNYGYFDAQLPRSAAQVFVLRFDRCLRAESGTWIAQREPLDTPQGCDAHVPILTGLDWVRVKALLVP
jgi:hypothetical protein